MELDEPAFVLGSLSTEALAIALETEGNTTEARTWTWTPDDHLGVEIGLGVYPHPPRQR